MRSPVARRWYLRALAAAVAACVAVGTMAGPAAADPNEDVPTAAELKEQLADSARGYLDAKAKYEKAKQRQAELTTQIAAIEAQLLERSAAVAGLASAAYQTGPLANMSTFLASDSPSAFVDRITLLEAIASDQSEKIQALADTRAAAATAKAEAEAQVVEQKKQMAEMTKRKRQAEKALAQFGGQTTAGFSGGSGTAVPAPRNADGSWPAESCSQDDPTTSGCLTPRTLHALRQAQAAGFTRYVSCYRSGSSGEHPKGRACDFSAQKGGFGGTATGDDRTYGNNLAAYFVRNAGRLGVLYVIWYRQIWMASTGWRAYSGGGDPSSDHTNHVHLSMY